MKRISLLSDGKGRKERKKGREPFIRPDDPFILCLKRVDKLEYAY